MKIVTDICLRDFEAWSGGESTLNKLNELLTTDEMGSLEVQIEECLGADYSEITDTTLNDFLWYEGDTIAQLLGYSDWEDFIKNKEESEEEADEDEEDSDDAEEED